MDEKAHMKIIHTAKEKMELLSYALQEAKRLDVEVIKKAYVSGLYEFDPSFEDDEEYNMQVCALFSTWLISPFACCQPVAGFLMLALV